MVIGYADIVGDLLHLNHIKFFKECKEHCDFLIVGVCSDAYATSYKRKPILDENTRLNTVTECKYVDKAIIVDERHVPITQEFIDEHNIDIAMHAHTLEEHDFHRQFYEVAIAQNMFKRMDYHEGVSTSKIIEIIKNRNFD